MYNFHLVNAMWNVVVCWAMSVLVLPLEIFIEDTPLHRRKHIKHVLAHPCGPKPVKCCHNHALHVSLHKYVTICIYIYIFHIHVIICKIVYI